MCRHTVVYKHSRGVIRRPLYGDVKEQTIQNVTCVDSQ